MIMPWQGQNAPWQMQSWQQQPTAWAPTLWQQATGQAQQAPPPPPAMMMQQQPVWAAPAATAPQPTTSWAQVPAAVEVAPPWQSAPGGTFDYAQAGPAPSTPSGIDQGYAQGPGAQTAGTPGTETKLGTGQPNTPPTPSGTIPPAQGSGRETTIDVNGQKVKLPISWMGGTFRHNINGAQEDSLTFLSRRLRDAQARGLNLQDPAVIYDEIARIRDDLKAAGVADADLDRLSGIGGLSTFIRGQQQGATGTGPTVPGTTPPGTTPPSTGTPGGPGQPATRNFGQFQTDDMASLLQAAANDPDRAAQILRLARGQTGRPLGRMADFRDSLYGRAFQTALSLAGADGFQGLEGMAGDFLNQAVLGNNLMGYGADIGRRIAGSDFAGVDSATMEKMLRAGLAMQGLNMGAVGGSMQQGRLEDILWQDWARNLASSSNDTRNFADLLAGSPFQRSMAAFR